MKKILCSVLALAALTLFAAEMPAHAAKKRGRPASSRSIDRESTDQNVETGIDRGDCPGQMSRVETYESGSGSGSSGFYDGGYDSGGYNSRGESF